MLAAICAAEASEVKGASYMPISGLSLAYARVYVHLVADRAAVSLGFVWRSPARRLTGLIKQ